MTCKWIKRAFCHSSLALPEDPFRVHCWVKEGEEPSETLPFEQFNFQLGLPCYTREEYQAFLNDEDWSFEETAYLLSLCNKYELCFFAIADAYCFSSDNATTTETAQPKKRTIEDIKERYFYVHGRIQKLKGSSLANAQEQQHLSFAYNKREELERKRELQILYSRTEEQIIVSLFLFALSFNPSLGRDFFVDKARSNPFFLPANHA
jgi:DNA methyltransferase 1-associated protein 1